ncbi:c-type cytochrome [Rhodobacterales bacterium HKCCE3408]|nr:c-type cytochrome [Rhodobacterales bacterium HKCCE3408]
MRAVLILALALASPAAAQDASRGERLFAENCVVCHGAEGRGGGPMAEILTVAPPDLRAIAARRGGAFPEIEIARIIDGRDPILSHGGDMPIFGRVFGGYDTLMREEGVGTLLTADEVVDLVMYLEGVQD